MTGYGEATELELDRDSQAMMDMVAMITLTHSVNSIILTVC